MSNSDFSPETRNSAIWSGDSRKVAQGKANEVILTKQGKLEIPDLSGVEAVQMGHVMEPVIARLASDKLRIFLNKIEFAQAHSKHPWFRSHFDFVGEENGKPVLVECKNYNAAVRNKFDTETGVIPAADLAQLVHEAAVFNVERIYLAVLFGGQEFVLLPFNISETQKEELIKKMAEVWGHCQAGTTMPPETAEQARLMFPVGLEGSKTASKALEMAVEGLRSLKRQIKALEDQEEALQTMVQGYLQDQSTLVTVDGTVLATWKSAKPSSKFNAKRFESEYPDFYKQFVEEVPGSRRFLIK